MIDIAAYCARIGYGGARTASLDTLRAIHALHPSHIPFENLNPLLRLPVGLDIDALQAKLIGQKRGGYCFEQNSLLKAALEAIGFNVIGLSGRVHWMRPAGSPRNPRTHMMLKVALPDGEFIADVGFGGLLLDAPLCLTPGLEQTTQWGTYRFAPFGAALRLQAKIVDAWQDVYEFTLEQEFAADYAVANWYTSTNPSSIFSNNLLMDRLTTEARISLHNRRLKRRMRDGQVSEAILPNSSALERALADDFGVQSPVDAATLFSRLPPE